MKKLAQVDEEGLSLIFKGWSDKETYGVIFDEEFQNAALARRTERLKSQQTQEHDNDIAYLENLARRFPIDADMPDASRLPKKSTKSVKATTKKQEKVTNRISKNAVNAQIERSNAILSQEAISLSDGGDSDDMEEDDDSHIADDASWTSEAPDDEEGQAQSNDSVATEDPNIYFHKKDVYVPTEFYFEARKLTTATLAKGRAERIANREMKAHERNNIKSYPKLK